jgi:hypothetical protein
MQYKIQLSRGTSRSILKHLDLEVVVYWKERFSAIFGYRNKIGLLKFYSATNSAPLASSHLNTSSLSQNTTIASLAGETALDFLEEVNGEDYSALREEIVDVEGKLLGRIHVRVNEPFVKNGQYKGRRWVPILSVSVYEMNGSFSIKSSRYGESGDHDRRGGLYWKPWSHYDLTPGRKSLPLAHPSRFIPAGERHKIYEVTVEDLPQEALEHVIAMQVAAQL